MEGRDSKLKGNKTSVWIGTSSKGIWTRSRRSAEEEVLTFDREAVRRKLKSPLTKMKQVDMGKQAAEVELTPARKAERGNKSRGR